jgi:glucuronate isomerase
LIRIPTSIRTSQRPQRWQIFLGITTTPSLRIRPVCRNQQIEQPELPAKEKVERLVPWLQTIENTAQYSWLLEMCQVFFNFQDDRITLQNWEALYDQSLKKCMQTANWEQTVLEMSGLDQVYLTNDFDDPSPGI